MKEVSVVFSTKCRYDERCLTNDYYAKPLRLAANFSSRENDHNQPCHSMDSTSSNYFQRVLSSFFRPKT